MNKNIFVVLGESIFSMAVPECVVRTGSMEVEVGEQPTYRNMFSGSRERKLLHILACDHPDGACYVAGEEWGTEHVGPKLSQAISDQLTYGNLEYWGCG